MREEVFRPLGMTTAAFGITHSGQPEGHTKGKPDVAMDANPEFFAPAGNIYLSLDDWARFCIDQIDGAGGHGKLLKPTTYALEQTAQPNGIYALGWGAVPKGFGRQGPLLTHDGSARHLVRQGHSVPDLPHRRAPGHGERGGGYGRRQARSRSRPRPSVDSLAPAAPVDPKPPS